MAEALSGLVLAGATSQFCCLVPMPEKVDQHREQHDKTYNDPLPKSGDIEQHRAVGKNGEQKRTKYRADN